MSELLDLALRVAARSARFLEDGWARREVVATKSSSTDIVTQMDQGSERLLVDHILAARPDDGIIGEEGSDRAGTTGVTWVIDPLDGTVNYLYGFPSWAVSVGVLVDGKPTYGVVHAPALRTVWHGTAGSRHSPTSGPSGPGTSANFHRLCWPLDSATRPESGPSRAESSPNCCPGCVTSAGQGRQQWTCAGSRRVC